MTSENTPSAPLPLRVFHIDDQQVREIEGGLATLAGQPLPVPGTGYLWIAATREAFAAQLPAVQEVLGAQCGQHLVDLHVADLLNDQLPSHYDYTSWYDLLAFRRLATRDATAPVTAPLQPQRSGLPVLKRIDTRPVGFAIFDRLLLSVHPDGGEIRDGYAARLLGPGGIDPRAKVARLPTGPADLMLRILNRIVDAYLDLRRDLTRQLDHWQAELVDPHSRFKDWGSLLAARQSLAHLSEVCEDQQAAMQDWIDALETLPVPQTPAEARRHELLMVRARDLLEHIARVLHHVQRLESNAETAVQMHFNVQSNRANDIMRTLTVITAVFLPLNLIAGVFGMNFEFIPLVHKADGFWLAMGAMLLIAAGLIAYFWRKRFLERSR